MEWALNILYKFVASVLGHNKTHFSSSRLTIMEPTDNPEPMSVEVRRALAKVDRYLAEHRTAMKEGRLMQHEIFWRDHYDWLKEKGYVLSPRYSPQWEPSWINTDKDWSECANSNDHVRDFTLSNHIRATHMEKQSYDDVSIKATRLIEGSKVVLRKIKRDSSEADFGKFFSSAPRSSDPRNHCIPVYEVLDILDDEKTSIMVKPSLPSCLLVDFDTVGEVIEYVRQMLEVSVVWDATTPEYC